MEVWLALVGFVGLPVIAWRGGGFRRLYLAAAFLGVVTCVLFNDPPLPDPKFSAEINRQIAAIMYGIFGLGLGLLGGGIFGACLYRRRTA